MVEGRVCWAARCVFLGEEVQMCEKTHKSLKWVNRNMCTSSAAVWHGIACPDRLALVTFYACVVVCSLSDVWHFEGTCYGYHS